MTKKRLSSHVKTATALLACLTASSVAISGEKGKHAIQDGEKRNAKEYWQEFKQDSEQNWEDTKSAFRDGWIEGKLETALIVNRHLDAFDIDISVDNNEARLSGSVESDTHKELATNIALGIEGIDSVDNRLKVEKSTEKKVKRPDQSRRSFSQYMEDISTTAEIKGELLASSNVSGLDVNVDTYRNKVILSGRVETTAEKALAEAIAVRNKEVEDVVNNLKVAQK
ncbi:BON domain-containing protein [Exilibacterium tricleocarpae]|uniref:BON domain-containing protein n=1 Tax=Exilibacterium tricleocarpae TaxID=2591008 RepID=A0A545SMU1_9GAMM|nr:BON domain-containing protein [Exilibacterium tricleocarpae]TQV66308.1 BON domain-containing protein [Exilibacterium tricleocarpae]